MANEFLKSEIRKIKRNTERNYHSENKMFIAKKINSPLLKEFESIRKAHMKMGYMDDKLWKKSYSTYQKLMVELKIKNPKQYQEVYGSLWWQRKKEKVT